MAYVFVSPHHRRHASSVGRALVAGLVLTSGLVLGVASPAPAAVQSPAFQQEQTTVPEAAPASTDGVTSSQPPPVATDQPPSTAAETPIPETSIAESTATTAPPLSDAQGHTDGSSVDGSSTTIDPLSGEGANEDVPDGSIEVPEPTTYGGQGSYKPAQVLWSNVEAAEDKLAEVELKRTESIKQIRTLRVRLKELSVAKDSLGADGEATLEELLKITDQVKDRATHDFMDYSRNGRSNDAIFSSQPGADGGIDMKAVVAEQRRLKIAEMVLSVGNDEMSELAEMKDSLTTESLEVFERLRVTNESLAIAEQAMAEHDTAAEQAKIEYEAFRIGSEIFIDGAVFPIARPYSLPLIDSFGFPRMPGTPDEHWHEGIDLFAAKGTPLVATERGVITRLGSGRLGGLKFWLVGESGSEWYYAHLDSFAPGMANGMVVEAGDLVGYVGNTGNAKSTPPHLHMELHPGGDRPVNPYPLLKVLSDVEILGVENGTYTDSPYQPYIRPGSDDDLAEVPVDGEPPVEAEPTSTSEPEPSTSTDTPPTSPTPTEAPATTVTLTSDTKPVQQASTTIPATPTSVAPKTTATSSVQPTDSPICTNADTDPDGDGWGFENDTSCVVP